MAVPLNLGKKFLAFAQRQPEGRVTFDVQEVECNKGKRTGGFTAEVLERLERGTALIVEGNQFAIDHGFVARDLAKLLDN
jgi:hypothetical protein